MIYQKLSRIPLLLALYFVSMLLQTTEVFGEVTLSPDCQNLMITGTVTNSEVPIPGATIELIQLETDIEVYSVPFRPNYILMIWKPEGVCRFIFIRVEKGKITGSQVFSAIGMVRYDDENVAPLLGRDRLENFQPHLAKRVDGVVTNSDGRFSVAFPTQWEIFSFSREVIKADQREVLPSTPQCSTELFPGTGFYYVSPRMFSPESYYKEDYLRRIWIARRDLAKYKPSKNWLDTCKELAEFRLTPIPAPLSSPTPQPWEKMANRVIKNIEREQSKNNSDSNSTISPANGIGGHESPTHAPSFTSPNGDITPKPTTTYREDVPFSPTPILPQPSPTATPTATPLPPGTCSFDYLELIATR